MKMTINQLNDGQLALRDEMILEGWEVTKPDFPDLLCHNPGRNESKFIITKQAGERLSRKERLSANLIQRVTGLTVEVVFIKRSESRVIRIEEVNKRMFIEESRKMPSIGYGRMSKEMDLNSPEVKEQIHKDDIDEYMEVFSNIKPTILTDEQREELRIFREKSAKELAEKEAEARRRYEEMKMVQSQMGVFDTIEGRHQSVDETMKEIKDIIRGGRAPNLTNTPMSNENDEGGK